MSKIIDIKGKKFGRLTVLELAEPHYKPSGQKVTMWKCKCDCGKETIVSSSELRSGGTKSCGCVFKDFVKDLTGKTFGYLTVLQPAQDQHGGRTRWVCQCVCGKTVIRRSDGLQSGKKCSCGCKASELLKDQYAKGRKTSAIDLMGKVFGRLTVVSRDTETKTSNGSIRWICQCSCGNTVSVTSSRLIRGTSRSCGCYARENSSRVHIIDLTGKQFGNWTVLSRAEDYICKKNGIHCPRWICQCECGAVKTVFGSVLRNGSSQSCGCLRESTGERTISEYLQKYNINFIREFSFDDLLSSKGSKLKFDFALFKDDKLQCLVEFQGEQHYETDPSKSFGYAQRTYTDKRKRHYCRAHHIDLYEIKYDSDIISEIAGVLLEEGLI